MSEQIRVLQVFSQMNRGGAETMIMNLYRNIDRSKIQFDFVVHTSKKGDYDEEIKSLGGNIYQIPRYSGKNHFQYQKAWKKFLKKNPHYKLIHGHVRSTASIYLKIAKKFGMSTIAHSHSTSSGKGVGAIVKKILQIPLSKRADYLFACSQDAGEWLFGKKACKMENFFILNNAIDAKEFIFNKEIRNKKRIEFNIQNNFVIGHVGRFDTAKNQDFLVDIFQEIHNKEKNATLLLIGDGNLRDKIKKKVDELGLSKNVIFTGVRSDIAELYQAMDVFVFPSKYEGLGIAVIEAQAAGLNCIVSDAIPKEAYVTNLLNSLSIKQHPITLWANNILDIQYAAKRDNMYNHIKVHGFDIINNSEWIEKFYKKIH